MEHCDDAASQTRLLGDDGRANSSMYDALVPKKEGEQTANNSMASPVTGTVVPVTGGEQCLQQSGFPADDAVNVAVTEDEEAQADAAPCCCIKWRAPLVLSCYGLLTGAGSMLTQSLLIEVNRDYFGSDQRAGMITSIIAAAVAFVNLMLVTPYGRLIDSLGRRPFFLANAVLTVVQFSLLAAFPKNPVPFLAASSVNNLIQSSYQGAYIADMITPENRGYAFTITQGFGVLTMMCALPIGFVQASDEAFFIAAVVCSGAALAFAYFFVKESLPKAQRTKFSVKGAFENPLKGVKILVKSRSLLLITLTACLVATADDGTSDIYMYYLNQRVGFTPQDNAIFFVEMSFLSVLSLFLLFPILQKYLSAVTIICIALASNAALEILAATVWARWAVFAAIAPTYAGLVLANPVLNAMITNIGRAEDVGKRITAMTAVTDFCNAVGPLMFSLLYGLLPAGLAALPFFVAFGLCVMGCLITWFFLAKAIRHDQQKLEDEMAAESAQRLLNDEESATVRADEENDERTERAAAAVRTLYDEDDLR